ncbi:hypothetical protein ACFOE1_08665 [Agromyces mediolanus]|uniref:Uncharacterized protein n=1 Tax=Agromyces mediolanus TaxID=41986 RepID=A0A918CDD0_AGRME|nr:hypothetical protein [Agromyces mediolanus]GGR18394.1 hypothetical protein GCM10010196_09360 [Agromyces mediolanus]GLJ71450.1 hypothetical protein GCM10017583_07060 [Agromyces mediolanus]
MPTTRAAQPATRVVHLVDRLDDVADAAAPVALRLPRRLGTPGRLAFAAAAVIATAVAAWGVVLLWTEETPGWWFSLLFSVLLGAMGLVPWFLLAGSIGAAREDREAQAAWSAARDSATPTTGRVVARRTQLAEEGTPTSFELDVDLADGSRLTAEWRLERAAQRLLQSQVPGVGAAVRVWRAAGVPEAPLVVEVADPSVVG